MDLEYLLEVDECTDVQSNSVGLGESYEGILKEGLGHCCFQGDSIVLETSA